MEKKISHVFSLSPQAEEDARQQLAEARKAQREEREIRRKADLEKKKQDAIDRRYS